MQFLHFTHARNTGVSAAFILFVCLIAVHLELWNRIFESLLPRWVICVSQLCPTLQSKRWFWCFWDASVPVRSIAMSVFKTYFFGNHNCNSELTLLIQDSGNLHQWGTCLSKVQLQIKKDFSAFSRLLDFSAFLTFRLHSFSFNPHPSVKIVSTPQPPPSNWCFAAQICRSPSVKKGSWGQTQIWLTRPKRATDMWTWWT